MVCDVCGKHQATVHLTEIIDDQMNELHLCEECAKQKSVQMESQFGLSDLLAGLAEFEKPTVEKETPVAACPTCKLSYADFKKIGRLGCGDCYAAFKRYLGPLLKRIHGSGQHTGKMPITVTKVVKKTFDAQQLRQRLHQAIEDEAFEEAARIRDQIRDLEQAQQKNNEADPEMPPPGA